MTNHNGSIYPDKEVCISADNRSFKYGDGCFETLKMVKGKLPLGDLHFDRLFSSLSTLQFAVAENFTRHYLHDQICKLAEANGHQDLARIRLTIYRMEACLANNFINKPGFIIQSWKGQEKNSKLNQTGYSIGFYPEAKKSCDIFSMLKSNNYLPYVMAAMWAQNNKLDDCLVFNSYNRIADATIANVFIVADEIIKTPSLHEGCVSGVMRKHLLTCFQKKGIAFEESELSKEDVLHASEVFLTNAIYGIRWVKKIGEKSYDNTRTTLFYEAFIHPLNR